MCAELAGLVLLAQVIYHAPNKLLVKTTKITMPAKSTMLVPQVAV